MSTPSATFSAVMNISALPNAQPMTRGLGQQARNAERSTSAPRNPSKNMNPTLTA